MTRFLTIVFCLAFGAAAASAQCGGGGVTGVPDLDQSLVTWGLGAGESATVFVVPDGTGEPLTAAHRPAGTPVDATIHLVLLDPCDFPIWNFPREDMWLESGDGGLVPCNGGTVADSQTDPNGHTSWSAPLRAGGHSQSVCRVLVNGMALGQPLPLHFVSADINGDRQVNLADVALFAQAYASPYGFAADLHPNGVVNLSDIAVMARSMGAHCP
ncbi:MAG: hypothetical protein IPK64_02555 [bacterium]|nr:hypothetical protein [bacterium]